MAMWLCVTLLGFYCYFIVIDPKTFIKIGSLTAEILLTLSFCGWSWVVGGLYGKSFSCLTQLRLCWVEVELSCG